MFQRFFPAGLKALGDPHHGKAFFVLGSKYGEIANDEGRFSRDPHHGKAFFVLDSKCGGITDEEADFKTTAPTPACL